MQKYYYTRKMLYCFVFEQLQERRTAIVAEVMPSFLSCTEEQLADDQQQCATFAQLVVDAVR